MTTTQQVNEALRTLLADSPLPANASSAFGLGRTLQAAGTVDENMVQLLLTTEMAHARVNENLLDATKALRDRMERVAQLVADGKSVNALGEVQQLGADVDRYCALREAAAEQAMAVRSVVADRLGE